MLLGQLAGKLSIHLSSEDKFVYPKLMQHQNAAIQATSKAFAAAMGSLAQIFEQYKSKYLGASKITEHIDTFISESKQVFSALNKRIKCENRELYPLLNK